MWLSVIASERREGSSDCAAAVEDNLDSALALRSIAHGNEKGEKSEAERQEGMWSGRENARLWSVFFAIF